VVAQAARGEAGHERSRGFAEVLVGRVWKYGHDINTDLIIPGYTIFLPLPEQVTHCFEANRPGWAAQVAPGDVLIAGRNFGVGGGRAIGAAFLALGISVVVAESFNGLGLRNCVNAGLPVLPCPGVLDAFEEGDVAEVDWANGTVRNATTGTTVETAPLPESIRAIVEAGGVEAVLREQGYLAPLDQPVS
jgi:3-isopropylmalate/(R)-2-methylmalate dehydratase small subunit